MDLHDHDARRCANPGCHEPARQEFVVYLAEQKALGYCGEACRDQHAELLKRHSGEREQ